MLLHVVHAAHHGRHKIEICTVHTDVVVLTVAVAQIQPAGSELWLVFGTGKCFRYLAAHEIAAVRGPRVMPILHALTGCHTESGFAGHGKKTTWAIWTVLPELTTALLKLCSVPSHIPEDAMHTIPTSSDTDKARKKLFTSTN